VALDGKPLRHCHNRSAGQAALRLVSAWASANRLVLGQVAVANKSNESTALPALIRRLDLEGCRVTTDAPGCQTEIVAAIVERQGNYALAVTGNQGTLHHAYAGMRSSLLSMGRVVFHRTRRAGRPRQRPPDLPAPWDASIRS
jgi:predicted transposase YbfD/YdcC